MTLHQESHSESHPWMKCVSKQFPEVYGWAHCALTCTPLFPPCLPHPPFPPTTVTSVRNNMIYHTNISFSTNVIALISLLTFPTIPPACIFHAHPETASMHPHPPMIVVKIRCLIFHSMPGALCATIMFTSFSTSLEAGQFSSVCPFLSLWRFRLQRERDERHPAASSRSQERRVLICWRFVRRMKGRRGAAKSF